ncbi:MAG: STAS domain-containing protein [Pseudomonadales bacterium]|nr:STAS domain-containing protein [Pseudomonadales bacterium]
MTVSVEISNDVATIRIVGSFNYSSASEFQQVCDSVSPTVSRYRIDLAQASMVDSAALGALLNLRRRLADVDIDIDIDIENPTLQVRKILEVSRMDKKFNISAR